MSTAISIIIPIFNAERYLRNCIDSVLAQTMRDIHVILVDDGSTDGSLRLCEKYAYEDNRVTVIHKENGGVSSARNAGMRASKDDYLIFVDADDYITPECCDILMREHLESGAEFVLGGHVRINIEGVARHVPHAMECAPWRNRSKEMCDIYLSQMLNSPAGRLYLRSKIKEEFDESIPNGEDLLFNLAYLRGIVSIAVLTKPCYHYINRDRSLSRRYHPDYVDICKYMHREVKRQFNELADGYDEKRMNYLFAINIRRAISILARADNVPFTEKQKILVRWLNDDELYLNIQNSETPTAISKLFVFIVGIRNATVMLGAIALYNLLSGAQLKRK